MNKTMQGDIISRNNGPCRLCFDSKYKVHPATDLDITALKMLCAKVSQEIPTMISLCIFCSALLKKHYRFHQQCTNAMQFLNTKLEEIKPQTITSALKQTPMQYINIAPIEPTGHSNDGLIKEENEWESMTCDDVDFHDSEDNVSGFNQKDEENSNKNITNNDTEINVMNKEKDFSDDEDMPLIVLSGRNIKKTKSSKKTERSKDKNGSTTKDNSTSEPNSLFSKRMVRETEQYVVIKLTKEQVLDEIRDRLNSEGYLRARHRCEKCAKAFNFQDVLDNHMLKHVAAPGHLECDICHMYCPHAVSMRGHMKSHTTRYKCKVCSILRASRQQAVEHYARVHAPGAALYRCNMCRYVTDKRASIQVHARSHTPRAPLTCEQCGVTCRTKEGLRVHTLRAHTTDAVTCTTCGRRFAYAAQLARHVDCVHGDKNHWYCVECDTTFKSKECLKVHFEKSKKHRGFDFICRPCKLPFPNRQEYVNHKTSAHGDDARHPCTSCDKTYGSREALRSHVRRKHAELVTRRSKAVSIVETSASENPTLR